MKVEAVKYNIIFNAGLTKAMQLEVSDCHVKKIENSLKRQGINADFKDNKVVAWCVMKCCEFINSLNKNYNLNIALPNGTFVEDFSLLESIDTESIAFVNQAPTRLYKHKNIIIPEKTIFFTKNLYWENIDYISDKDYEKGQLATGFFLEMFLHEFMHIAHADNLVKKLGGVKLLEKINMILNTKYKESFRIKYAELLSQICEYAARDPMEAIACDLAKRAANSIDKETLIPQSNIFASAPYKKHLFLIPHKESELDKTLRHFWNGKFK